MVNVSFGYISLSTCFEEDLISFWRLENRTKSFFELSIDCDDLVTIKISRKINVWQIRYHEKANIITMFCILFDKSSKYISEKRYSS